MFEVVSMRVDMLKQMMTSVELTVFIIMELGFLYLWMYCTLMLHRFGEAQSEISM